MNIIIISTVIWAQTGDAGSYPRFETWTSSTLTLHIRSRIINQSTFNVGSPASVFQIGRDFTPNLATLATARNRAQSGNTLLSLLT